MGGPSLKRRVTLSDFKEWVDENILNVVRVKTKTSLLKKETLFLKGFVFHKDNWYLSDELGPNRIIKSQCERGKYNNGLNLFMK